MNIYQSLYDLINTYIYGGAVAIGSYQELCCILFATLGWLLLLIIPFLLIFRVIMRLI